MKRKKLTALFLALLMVFTLAACGSPSGGQPSSSGSSDAGNDAPDSGGGKTYQIAMTIYNAADETSKSFADAAIEAMEEMFAAEGIQAEIKTYDMQGEVSRQTDILENLIMEEVDMIIASAFVDADAAVSYIQQLGEKNIPVIGLTVRVDPELCPNFYFVGSDETNLGMEQAKYVADKIPENAKVLYMANRPAAYNTPYRQAGFIDTLAELRPDAEVLSQMNIASSDEAMRLMEDWISTYPEFDCVVSATAKGIVGGIEAMKAAGKDLNKIVTVGIDAESISRGLLREKLLSCAVAQYPVAMGEVVADVCLRLINGETPEFDNFAEPLIVTQDNVREYFGEN